jgi:hypothetical protein
LTSRSRTADALIHPAALAALLVWLVNDHWAKAAHPGWTTGKLSDVASLIVFPLIPIAALALWRRRRGGPPPGPPWSAAWLLATGATMAAINLFDPAAWVYRHGLALAQWPLRALGSIAAGADLPAHAPVHLTMDPTDLFTLPALVVPWLLVGRHQSRAQFGTVDQEADARIP